MLLNPYHSATTARIVPASKFEHHCEPLRTATAWIRAVAVDS